MRGTTDGSLRSEARAILRLGWPISLTQFGLVSLQLVDTAVIGRVSVDDLAGASIGRSIGYAAFCAGYGIASALEPLAAQAVGAGEPAEAYSALRATVRVTWLAWLPMIALSFGAAFLLEPIGIDGAVASRARQFLAGQVFTLLFLTLFTARKNFLQAHHRTRPALLAAGIANIVNFVVASLLVRGDDALAAVGIAPLGLPRLGAFGAGLASSIASFVLAAVLVPSVLQFKTEPPAKPVGVRAVMRLGGPMALQLLAEIGVFSLVAVLAGRFGADVASAHQIALGLASFTFMGALGVSGATAVRVGHAVGAGESPRNAGFAGIGVGVAMMAVSAVAFALIPRPLASLFSRDEALVALAAKLIAIASVFQLFDGMQAVAAGALRGVGDARVPFFGMVAAHWLVGFPTAIGLGFGAGWGVKGLWVGLTLGLVSAAIVLVGRFRWLTLHGVRRV